MDPAFLSPSPCPTSPLSSWFPTSHPLRHRQSSSTAPSVHTKPPCRSKHDRFYNVTHTPPVACVPRPECADKDPAFLPQTIEYAIRQAQNATRTALCAGLTHLHVELPMGRSRAHWYSMSPSNSWYSEASILAFHYAELFRGLKISLVLGTGPGVTHPVRWIADLRRLVDGPGPDTTDNLQDSTSIEDGRVVIFAAISERQRDLFQSYMHQLERSNDVKAVILFCSYLETPLSQTIAPFQQTYICRSLKKLALLREGYDSPWSIFIEIAVFEYEWIGDREVTPNWAPVQEELERFVLSNGAFVKRDSVYFATNYGGCEAGFWPFMTLCRKDVLPLDGLTMERASEMKKEKSRTRPFGFF